MVFLLITFVTLLLKETQKEKIKKVADEAVKQQLREQLFKGTEIENLPQEDSNIFVRRRSQIGARVVLDIACKGYPWTKGYKPSFKENIFLYASLFLGILITIFTFVWGVL